MYFVVPDALYSCRLDVESQMSPPVYLCTTQTLCFVLSSLSHFNEWLVILCGGRGGKNKTFDQGVSGPAAGPTGLKLVLRL